MAEPKTTFDYVGDSLVETPVRNETFQPETTFNIG